MNTVNLYFQKHRAGYTAFNVDGLFFRRVDVDSNAGTLFFSKYYHISEDSASIQKAFQRYYIRLR